MKAINQIKGLWPAKLPVGMTAHKAWADNIIKTYGLPDNDSIRFTLAVNLMHVEQTTHRKADFFFYKKVHKGMANEVANAVIMDLKQKQAEEAEAAKAKEAEEPATKAGPCGE